MKTLIWFFHQIGEGAGKGIGKEQGMNVWFVENIVWCDYFYKIGCFSSSSEADLMAFQTIKKKSTFQNFPANSSSSLWFHKFHKFFTRICLPLPHYTSDLNIRTFMTHVHSTFIMNGGEKYPVWPSVSGVRGFLCLLQKIAGFFSKFSGTDVVHWELTTTTCGETQLPWK